MRNSRCSNQCMLTERISLICVCVEKNYQFIQMETGLTETRKKNWKTPLDFARLGLLSLNPQNAPCSPFLLEAHNGQRWWIKDFFLFLNFHWINGRKWSCNSYRTTVFTENLQRAVKTTSILSLSGIKLLCEAPKILAVAWIWEQKQSKAEGNSSGK